MPEELRVRAESRPIATGRKANGTGANRRTSAVPTYVMAEAETTPLPKIVVANRPTATLAKRRGFARLGDLPMRVIYRLFAGAIAVMVATAAVVVFLVTRGGGHPDGTAAALTQSRSAETPSVSVSPSVSASPSASASPTSTQGVDPLDATLADPRVPGLPATHRLRKLPGRTAKTKRWIKDRRTGIAIARLGGRWKIAKALPFATRQVLPLARGAGHRALLISCPVPTLVRRDLRDTAVIAARWTLNHQPGHAAIRWVASQPLKVDGHDGWLLAYQARYPVKGKKRASMDALVLVDIPGHKPAMMFMSVPDVQRNHWREINTAISALKVLKAT